MILVFFAVTLAYTALLGVFKAVGAGNCEKIKKFLDRIFCVYIMIWRAKTRNVFVRKKLIYSNRRQYHRR